MNQKIIHFDHGCIKYVYMLKHLFTSKARIKLLTLFLLNPNKEYYVRQLTRELDEQINSVRRELDNLKKMGLLRSRMKSRKKFFTVNVNHVLFRDLRNVIIKARNSSENLVKNIVKMGTVDFLLVSGVFLLKGGPVDLLIVGEIDKEALEKFLDTLETEESIKFSILSTDDFVYRVKCRDQFILDLVQDGENIIGVNKLEKHFS
ncbi:MAG: DNA-binding transcriptional ArsR family regulator [Oceanicoccus sp.]|jgi:DNA-binding transcriptional ArsR family regulator